MDEVGIKPATALALPLTQMISVYRLKEIPLETKAPVDQRPIEVLLVEDNPGDVILVKEMLRHSRFPIRIDVARNGEEALTYLRRKEPFTEAKDPDLILLDLYRPRVDGQEVLAEIRREPAFRQIPVLILTSSRNDLDIQRAYQSEANFYLVKPMDLSEFPALMEYLENFWFKNISEQKAKAK